ncbi:MAG: L,D-transpeptidase family protein [Gammaproteobacteria bacterium]
MKNNCDKINISIGEQRLILSGDSGVVMECAVSTAENGAGEDKNSERTPRGAHIIRAKIGANAPINTVFVGRRATGEFYTRELAKLNPDRDWILTRILWLSGLEVGCNRLGNVDTMQRYIYIHGCPDTTVLGKPGSRGCIRMRNADIIRLFDLVDIGTKVIIAEKW